jgi:CDP-glycerol glycerophosphotransferase (TagB/SpsB family)
VLYAPTWSPASSLNRIGLALVDRLMSLPVNVIVKLHDRSRDPRPQYSGGVDWVSRLTPLLDRPHGRLATTANITPCLVAADVMISDHSSAAFEYLLLDRPLVRIDIPELIRQANVHPEYVQLLADAADNVRSLDETIAAVDRAIADPRALSASRRRIAADLFYRPGTASARCAAALYDILELTPHASIAAAATEIAPCLQSA